MLPETGVTGFVGAAIHQRMSHLSSLILVPPTQMHSKEAKNGKSWKRFVPSVPRLEKQWSLLLSVFCFSVVILPNPWEYSVGMNFVCLRGKRKDQGKFPAAEQTKQEKPRGTRKQKVSGKWPRQPLSVRVLGEEKRSEECGP